MARDAERMNPPLTPQRDEAAEKSVRFSIVIPAYNAADSLERTVASALVQRGASFEVIVSDDGSADQTLAVAQRLADADPRVRVTSAENGGCSAARNRGFELARGEFCVPLDSDDVLDEHYLEQMVAFIEANPGCDIYSCNGTRRLPTGAEEPFFEGPAYASETSWTLDDLIPEDRIFVMAAVRRELWKRLGGFRTTLRYAEDYDFWLRALAGGATHRYTPQRLATAVFRTTSKSKNLIPHAEAQIRMFEDLSAMRGIAGRQQALIAEKIAALRARIERVELEERLQRGDYSGARAAYRRLRPAYRSARLYAVGLAAMTLSPALYAKLFAARRAGRLGS
jgi:hypothetical protein